MSIEPEHIDVQQDIQENYIVDDREITENPDPKFNNNILVTYDHLSNRLYFNMFYTFDDRDLESKEISIVWLNANNEKGLSLCVDKTLVDDRLVFAWNVPQEATYKSGTVQFAIRIISNNYVWNSLIGTVQVQQGLITEEFNSLEDAQLEPGWVDYIEGKYKLYLQDITEQDYNNLPTKNSKCVYLVKQPDNYIASYLGTTLLSGPRHVLCTQEEYDNIPTPDPNTIYIILPE